MGAEPLHDLSLAAMAAGLRRKELTARGLAEACLRRIESIDREVRSFVHVAAGRALEDADRADRELASGVDRGPLHGIPYALKDIYATAGIPTTCNSKLRAGHLPREDAAVEARLRAGGAVLVGKLNTHEFALGGPGFDLPFPPARNPWNVRHFTGGSSSGSGAAVGARLVPLALGSDTGGSIRSPACHCGVVGLKPTYGLVSRRGVFPLSYSLDHCGPLTRTVEDAALAMKVIAGFDPGDPSSVDVPVPDFTADLARGVDGLRVGYVRHFIAGARGVSPEIVGSVDTISRRLADLGAIVEEVELPDFDLFKACGRILMTAEAFAIHEADLRARPQDFGRYTLQRIAPAAGLSAADIIQATRVRQELTVRVNHGALSHYEVLLTGNALTPAARLDEFPLDWPPPSLAVAVQTVPFNVTGNPALALPVGLSRSGLPLGIQVVGRPFDEKTVFRVGAAIERAVAFHRWRPSLADDLRAEGSGPYA
jgi:aspartyl-tRNA(Asn)/glutamyl-tRNA(Gln) amidotransferase subunit A